jgi:hypothetical protein
MLQWSQQTRPWSELVTMYSFGMHKVLEINPASRQLLHKCKIFRERHWIHMKTVYQEVANNNKTLKIAVTTLLLLLLQIIKLSWCTQYLGQWSKEVFFSIWNKPSAIQQPSVTTTAWIEGAFYLKEEIWHHICCKCSTHNSIQTCFEKFGTFWFPF